MAKAQAAVARLHKTAMTPMHFLRLQRSMSRETGKEKTRMAQETAETKSPHWVSVSPQSLFRKGNRETTTRRSM